MIMWVIQIFVALAFLATGTMKLVKSKAQLAANPHMGWMHGVPEARIKLLGAAEVLGAIGLVAPMATGIAPLLTRAAAVCLATLMGGAVATHTIRREPAAAATILAMLTMLVATFR
jgi:uncharacterized membrane protein YphA (DoxX/SURF4 family)